MKYAINRVAVIGAGTMGAAIAAHLANIGIPTSPSPRRTKSTAGCCSTSSGNAVG